MIPALTNLVVFACHCQPQPQGFEVGILALSEDFEPGLHTLYNGENESYQVYIPNLPNPSYHVILNYGYSIQNPVSN